MSDQQSTDGGALSRREFVALSLASSLALGTGANAAPEPPVTEHELSVPTPDGSADALLVTPVEGRHAGVLMWTDAFGLRPAMREMARRLAGAGYAVLVPNPYYRKGHAPLPAERLDFQNPADRAKLTELMGSLTSDAVDGDARAYATFLDAQAVVDTTKKLGVHGYCMGGRLSFRTAAAVPGRFGAVGSFHGGGLVSTDPASPHLLIPKMHARFYIGIAAGDDAKEPETKNTLRGAFEAAGQPAQIEVYPDTLHGWCVKDMPLAEGKPIYNEQAAERAWGKLLELYRTALA